MNYFFHSTMLKVEVPRMKQCNIPTWENWLLQRCVYQTVSFESFFLAEILLLEGILSINFLFQLLAYSRFHGYSFQKIQVLSLEGWNLMMDMKNALVWSC